MSFFFTAEQFCTSQACRHQVSEWSMFGVDNTKRRIHLCTEQSLITDSGTGETNRTEGTAQLGCEHRINFQRNHFHYLPQKITHKTWLSGTRSGLEAQQLAPHTVRSGHSRWDSVQDEPKRERMHTTNRLTTSELLCSKCSAKLFRLSQNAHGKARESVPGLSPKK